MDAETKREMDSILRELQSIINELDSIATGVRNDFIGIGNDKCARVIIRAADQCRLGKRLLSEID